jgi:hypothetical protein
MRAGRALPGRLPGSGYPRPVAQGRRVRRVVRRVDTWTVLRFSVLFYLSMLVVILVAGILLWVAASAAGVVDNFEKFIKDLFVLDSFHLRPGLIFRATLVGGLVLVLLGTGANVLMTVIYNLTSDVVGGIEVSVLEEETAPRRASV